MCVPGAELCAPCAFLCTLPCRLFKFTHISAGMGQSHRCRALGTLGVDPVSAGKPDFCACRQLLEEFLPNLWQEQLMVASEGPPTDPSFRRKCGEWPGLAH